MSRVSKYVVHIANELNRRPSSSKDPLATKFAYNGAPERSPIERGGEGLYGRVVARLA